MKIRKMNIDDIGSVVLLGQDTHELAVSEKSRWWSKERLNSWVEADRDILLVAEENDEIIAVLLTALHRPTQMIYLSDVVVKEGYRQKGIATQLIREVLKQAKQFGIDWAYGLTQTNNETIQMLLEKEGFTKGAELAWFEKKPL